MRAGERDGRARAAGPEPLLTVRDLTVRFRTEDGPVLAVDAGAGSTVAEREVLGLVGESGCGKSVTAMALTRLLPRNAAVSGSVRLGERSLLDLPESGLRDVRGRDIAYVFQEPMTSLNPVLTVGRQLGEVLRRHRGMRGAARARARPRCWNSSVSRFPAGGCASIRISSPAACGSG